MDRLRAIFTLIQMIISITIIIIFMYMFKKHNKKIRLIWAKIQIKLLGIKLEVIGSEDSNAKMIIMNHQSIMDIILLEYLSSVNLAWIAKKEIGDIPWFGHILKASDMIIVQRDSKSSLLKLIKDSKEKLSQNRPLAIFPEGTRTNGKKLRKFKAGAKIIANKFNLKVQPIVIINSLEILDSKKLIQKPGIVKIIYLPSIQASKSSTWYEDTQELMQITLKEELQKCKIV